MLSTDGKTTTYTDLHPSPPLPIKMIFHNIEIFKFGAKVKSKLVFN